MSGPVQTDLIAYLSGLTVTQGRLAGQAFHVLPWQRRFVRGALAPGVATGALSVARGNGKTALLSGIAAATLDGPLAVPRGETVIVASSFEQARIAFEHVAAFMGDKLDDKRRWKVWDTAQQARIECRHTGARVPAHGRPRAMRWQRSAPGTRACPGAGAGRRAGTVAGNDRGAHGGGPANGGGQATALPIRGARHAACG